MNAMNESGLGAGAKGWKAKQDNARRKKSRAASAEERIRNREIRKAHKMGLLEEQADQEQVEQVNQDQANSDQEQPRVDAKAVHQGGGWYTVEVNGIAVNDGKKMRKAQAEEVLEKFNG